MEGIALGAIFVLFLALTLGAAVFVVYSSILTHFQDPFVATPDPVLEKLLKILPFYLRGRKTFYELGAGKGRVALAVAQKFPRLKVVAIEKSKFLCWLMRQRAKSLKLKNLRILNQDLFKTSLRNAEIIYLYLSPRSLKRLKGFKKGALVITLDFPLPQRKPFKKFKTLFHQLFLYRG